MVTALTLGRGHQAQLIYALSELLQTLQLHSYKSVFGNENGTLVVQAESPHCHIDLGDIGETIRPSRP